MVKNRHDQIRSVSFSPTEGRADVQTELSTIARIRRRGGRQEFLAPQRLGFELLLVVEAGHSSHGVDFTDYALAPGSVLWVHAGQVQQWGQIAELEGLVAMFAEHTIDPAVRELLRAAGALDRNHWEQAAPVGSPLAEAFSALGHAATRSEPLAAKFRNEILTHQLSATLLELGASDARSERSAPEAADEIFRWFTDEVEQRFRQWHQVQYYATRLGYAPRTLSRAAQAHAGMSAKQFIDQRIVLEAKRLLAHGTASVAAIAEELGFDDPANFSKYFTQRCGLTPAVFRKTVRARGE